MNFPNNDIHQYMTDTLYDFDTCLGMDNVGEISFRRNSMNNYNVVEFMNHALTYLNSNYEYILNDEGDLTVRIREEETHNFSNYKFKRICLEVA